MRKTALFFITAALCFSLFCSCSGNGKQITFDESDPLALDIEVQWAIITDPYAACREEPSYSSETVSHFRKGELARITGEQTVKTDGKYEKWYNFDRGWVSGSAVKVYSNKLKAQKALGDMK